MQYKNLHSLLQTSPELSKFVAKLETLTQLSHFVATNLEPSLAQQCRVANLRDGSIILSTSSPAWNHKLRFVAQDLLSLLRKNHQWSGLKSIEVRVDYLPAHEYSTTTNLKRPLKLSAYNAKLLMDTANGVTCTKLAQALQRLAQKPELKHG